MTSCNGSRNKACMDVFAAAMMSENSMTVDAVTSITSHKSMTVDAVSSIRGHNSTSARAQ